MSTRCPVGRSRALSNCPDSLPRVHDPAVHVDKHWDTTFVEDQGEALQSAFLGISTSRSNQGDLYIRGSISTTCSCLIASQLLPR